MYIGAIAVEPLPEYRLLLTFENGEKRVFDVEPHLDRGIFRELRDLSMFRSVRIHFDSVAWANGADLCPEMLYEEGVRVEKESAAA